MFFLWAEHPDKNVGLVEFTSTAGVSLIFACGECRRVSVSM